MKTNVFMKLTIYPKFSVIALASILAACSATTSEDKKEGSKQERLEELKKGQASMAKEIAQLEKEMAAENPTAKTVKTKEVNVTELTPQKFDHYVQTQGSIEAEDNILVSAKSQGVVTAVYVSEGQTVSKGQALAQLDNAIILRSLEAMKSQYVLAKTVYERQKNLWDQKIGTEVQFLQAKTNMESLEKQLASLEEQNELTRIKSPIHGTVDDIAIKVGENTEPRMPAVRVVNTSDLKLVAHISEAYVTDIKKGNKVIVSIPELKKDIQAKVTFVGRTIDPLSRTFTVEIGLPSEANLRPNMTGVLKVVYHTEPAALTIPISVVQEVNGEKIVYIVETDGKQSVARRKVITVEGVYDNTAQIKGLKPGDKVITVGYQGLNEGEFVKL